jgi:superfamily II DNA/RNA helicase
MKVLPAGMTGTPHFESSTWNALLPKQPWQEVVSILVPNSVPRAVQVAAFGAHRILESRRHVVVSSPTNSGKSLIGDLILLQAISSGRRAILLEPLRALARERADVLQQVAVSLGQVLGRPFKVRLTTGDYRLDHERFTAPPPPHGELIVATPERLEAILRQPASAAWIASIGAVCVDEAHLLASPHRGPTLEYLLTSLLTLAIPPRLVLLSATLGDTTRLKQWLAPCNLIASRERTPPLHKEVIALDSGEEANEVVAGLMMQILAQPDTQALIFVYQTRSAEHLARQLTASIREGLGSEGALAYHAQMSLARRDRVRTAFERGSTRCLVTTTALGLGVNLPATHVVVRDTTFQGVGKLELGELLQLMGRAGRGNTPGHATVLIRPSDQWHPDVLASALHAEQLPDFTTSFEAAADARWNGKRHDALPRVAERVAAYLSRTGDDGTRHEEIERFFARSLSGMALAQHVPAALAWLDDPLHMLAYRDEHDRYHLTVLGRKATRAVIPLHIAAGLAQLVRDLLTVDESDHLLAQWRPLDHLFVLTLLHDRSPSLRPYGAALASQVDAWMEQHPEEIPVLYREWIRGEAGTSRANEVFGSLGVGTPSKGRSSATVARKLAYQALFHAIVLLERGKGRGVEDLARQWGIKTLEGVEERWRDEMLWLLGGLGGILDLRCFFYHLRESCAADRERIRRVKWRLARMRRQTWELQEEIKYCSPLGEFLASLRRSHRSRVGTVVGVGTIRRLEEAGIWSVAELATLGVDALVGYGIRRAYAEQICAYVRRRRQ